MSNLKNDDVCSFNKTKFNLCFFIYFSIMFTLYTITIVQLLAQIFIIIYVIFSKIKKATVKIDKNVNKSLLLYCLWFGLLTFIAFISKHWAYEILPGSKTVLTLFRIFTIGFFIILYCDSKQKMYSVLKSFIYSIVVMGIVALAVTPVSEYGKAGEEGFGTVIGIHRNQVGMIAAPMAFMTFYLYRNEGFKRGKLLSLFFIVLLLCSGSRTSIAQLVLLFVIYSLCMGRLQTRIKKIFGLLIIFIIGLSLVMNIPYLKTTFFDRIVSIIEVKNGNTSADPSTYGRSLYKALALDMFKSKPILGYGVDGFVTYFADHKTIRGQYIKYEAYSHCNYAELAANFGIVGLVIWYWMDIYIIINSFKYRKKDSFIYLVLILILSMIVTDTARINWSTHLSSYLYIIVYCLLQIHSFEYSSNQIKSEEVKK